MGLPGNVRDSSSDGLSPQAIRDQLDRILASDIFRRSERLSAFLRFVVVATLEGHGNTLKEQVLATELYGKPAAAPSDDNPVVRVDARRLRDKLREYYVSNAGDAVVISLPKGSYTPLFTHNAAPVAEATPSAATPARPWSRWHRVGVAAAVIALITLTALWVVRKPQLPQRVVSLTAYPGRETEPSISPDGNFVAFAWSGDEKPGPSDIWIKATDNEARRQLTNTADTAEFSPAWSPDGKQIAFIRAGEGVFVISQVGGAERKIGASGAFPAWTPDCKSLLVRDVEARGSPGGIYQIDLETLSRRRITQAPAGDGDHKFEVSPDGKTVAVNRYDRTGVADLYVVPIEGGTPRRLTDWNATVGKPAWTRDGREIIYPVAGRSLWRIPVRTGSPSRGTPLPEVTGIPVILNPSISRSGDRSKLVFETVSQEMSLRLVDLTTNQALAARPFLRSTRIDIPGRFSLDGKKIAYQTLGTGLSWGLYTANVDGSDLRQLKTAKDFGSANIGGWSPDGSSIVFDAAVDGNSDIYIAANDGSESRRLTNDPALDVNPIWSKDGQWIYFASSRTGRHELWKLPAVGGPAVQITRQGGTEPAESPDGRYLYYLDKAITGANGLRWTSQLKTVPVLGGEERTVYQPARYALWGVTERGVALLAVEKECDAIDLYQFDGNVHRIGCLPFRIPRWNGVRMGFSRDGTRALANQMDRDDADLMMIENFR